MIISNKIIETLAQRSQNISKSPKHLFVRFRSVFKKKFAAASLYIGAFVVLVAIIATGYYAPKESASVANVANDNTSKFDQTSVDDVVATGVAANVAQTVNLPIATSVANLAVSAQIKNEYAESTSINNSKPQIIVSTYDNRSVVSYKVKSGDTVKSLAKKFSISEQTIRWANDMLTSDNVSAGDTIRILPINGVLYSVKSSDTTESLAKKYKVDQTRLIGYNDLEVSGLKSNSSIILPDGVLPEEERPGYVAPVEVVSYYAGVGSGFGGRTWYISSGTGSGPYAYGNCTLYAYNRRVQLGLPISSNWGNASSWAYSARQAGLRVDGKPAVGAIMQNGGGLGHVAIVEQILDNGDLSVSEMNAYVSGGGWNIVSGRIVPAGNIGQYLYIH